MSLFALKYNCVELVEENITQNYKIFRKTVKSWIPTKDKTLNKQQMTVRF